jgi:hypothetical protein
MNPAPPVMSAFIIYPSYTDQLLLHYIHSLTISVLRPFPNIFRYISESASDYCKSKTGGQSYRFKNKIFAREF